MIVALIDNGSLEPGAHRNLRALAETLSARTGVNVEAVSWKHSDRIPAARLGGHSAATLVPWLAARLASGEREFVFVPFFVSPQGAIGSWLRRDLERLQREIGSFRFRFTASLADRGLAPIVADCVRRTIAAGHLASPPLIVVDHGGPSVASSILRNQIAVEVGRLLGDSVRTVVAASLEGAEHPHNLPLFADALAAPGFDRGDVVIAPLFLAPGRHAGPNGDLAQIAAAAEDRLTVTPLRCHFTESIGTHPLVANALAEALASTLSTLYVAA